MNKRLYIYCHNNHPSPKGLYNISHVVGTSNISRISSILSSLRLKRWRSQISVETRIGLRRRISYRISCLNYYHNGKYYNTKYYNTCTRDTSLMIPFKIIWSEYASEFQENIRCFRTTYPVAVRKEREGAFDDNFHTVICHPQSANINDETFIEEMFHLYYLISDKFDMFTYFTT